MKAVCHITCNLWKMNCYFLLLYAPRRGRKCQNYLALHLCRNSSTWRILARTWPVSLCPRSLGEMRNPCVVQSNHKHATHPRKSDSAFEKSNFVKQHKQTVWGVEGSAGMLGWLCWGTMELLGFPILHPKTPSFNANHYSMY